MPYSNYADAILDIARHANTIIMEYYQTDCDITIKEDHTPVTEADLAANAYIVEALQKLSPDIPVISEENDENDNEKIRTSPIFWLVDPLDGTKSFIKQTGEFTVNIGLIKDHKPIGGVITVPAKDLAYWTGADGKVYKQDGNNAIEAISCRKQPECGAVVVASKSHRSPETDDYINKLPSVDTFISASSSLKFCLIAEGKADIYPRFGRTMEWDTAAGHAILNAAGGSVHTIDDDDLAYGKEGLDNPFFIACGVL